MKYRLNRKSLERLKALVRAGDYVDRPWSFTAADSNALLGEPANWTEFGLWFLGYEQGRPDQLTDSTTGDPPQKSWFAYPFGKGEGVNLNALRAVARAAKAAGENDIAAAAADALTTAAGLTDDKAKAQGTAAEITFAAPATVRAASSAKKLPTFSADAYTGGAMMLEGWTHPVVVDFEGIDFSDHPRPVLRDHDPKLPLGHTTSIRVQDGVLKADGVISAAGEYVDEVIEAGKNNFPWQISMGSKVLKNQFVPEGTTADANGKTWAGPINIARQTALREISFLTLGADDDTSARIAARAAKGTVMKKKFAAWAKARGIQMADMEDDSVASAAKALFKAQMKCEADDPADEEDDGKEEDKKDTKSAAAPPEIKAAAPANAAVANAAITAAAELTKELRAAALAERQRLNSISTVLDEYRTQVDAARFAPIEAKAISGEFDRDKVELELIKARRPTMTAPNINTGAGSEADGQIIAAACARSMGVGEKAAYKGLSEKAGNIAASMRGLTIHAIIAASCARLGMHVRPGGIDDGFLGEFLRADRESHRTQLRAAQANNLILASTGAGFSTVSLTGITENILYKAMLEQYSLQATVVPDIAYERDTNDFKPFKVYRMTASGDFAAVGASGELKNISLQDESYTNQVATKGALLVLKREDIINDDMGALMQSPQVLGRKAALNRDKTVITSFLSGLTTVAPGASTGKTANAFNFFSAGALNYLSGGSSPLSITSLQTAWQKFVQQTDANGDPVGIMPDRLLVCPELKATADNLFSGNNLVVSALGSTSAAATLPNVNQHAGRYRPVMSPYLGGSSSVTGASATQWALLANPAGGMATVQIGYLRGQRTPIIRQVETDAAMLGIAYQAIYDFGVALLDYRCGVYSAGA